MKRCSFYAAAGCCVWVSVLARGALRAGCDGVPTVPGDAVTLQLVVSGLERPVDAQAPPGDLQRLFIVEQRGRIRILDLASGTLRPQPFLDIRSKVSCCGELGLLGLAFHPDYPSNGLFYVNYTRPAGAVCTASPPPGCTANRAAETVVARYQASPPSADVADPNSESLIIAFCQPFSNHNGGQIHFGPLDGNLYIATGDGGDAGDPCNSAQRGDSLLGKILRIDVDSDAFPTDPLRNYAIPPDNPFAAQDDGVRDEIWALGLRNPWRFSFDRGAPDGTGKGDVYIADVGQGAWEEIDYRRAEDAGGANYEWRVREGNHPFSSGTAFGPGTRVAPIYEYPHGQGALRGCSVTGGVAYRGCRMPDLSGTYFFADYCNGWIASFRISGGSPIDIRDRTADMNSGIAPATFRSVVAFGTDGLGEIYVLDLGGRAFKVIPKPSPNNRPTARIATDPDPPRLTIGGVPPELILDGSLSDDGDGGSQGLAFLWETASGPGGEEILQPTAARTAVRIYVPGVYVFRLTVSDGFDSHAAEVTVTVTRIALFRRADSNGDGSVDISDGVSTLLYLFSGSVAPGCEDAADADDTGAIDISDAVFTFRYLFLGGSIPPAPGPLECGQDPTTDALGCDLQGTCSPP